MHSFSIRSERRTKPRTLGGLVALSILAAAGALAAPGCDAIVDASADSCTTDADCVNYANSACDTAQGKCVSLDKCQSNSDCPDDQICRHFSPRTCVSLKTPVASDPSDTSSTEPSCNEIYPDDPAVWRDDATFLIGLTAPITAYDKTTSSGKPDSTGDAVKNGAILAVDEINDKGGINNSHKLALVICDDYGERNFAENNGLALADMGILTIIGPAYSGQTIDMATKNGVQKVGTVDRDVLSISPSATSPDVSGIEDTSPVCLDTCAGDSTCEAGCPDLVWRTSPSDEIQSKAIVSYFKELEPIVKNRTATPETAIKVTVLNKGDSYGKNLAKFIIDGLSFNGMKANQQTSAFKVHDYGESTPGAGDAAITATLAEQPDVVMIFGTGESGDIVSLIESGWTGTEDSRPYYVLADGGLVTCSGTDTCVFDKIINAHPGAEKRVRGTIPGTQSDLFGIFVSTYGARFPTAVGGPQTFGAAGAYDSVYLMTYAATAAGERPFSGEEIAKNLPLTASTESGAQLVQAGPLDFGPASNDLQNGIGINYDGASGPLDFDLRYGEAPSDIQIWCIVSKSEGPFSGRYYDAKTSTMKGTLDNDPDGVDYGTCPF
ncbi:MAG TPA: ABC transporter substrate-binding protein [Polyangiaceae bacterium]|jgi:branched-chain amino acid transport system substrate-binding protein|nr:ABC transporter substrate-binding protein [Polyangiaceae bacterium]